ncbi:hypothetical protein [Microbulbifer sp. ZKSA002]|uniref:hypothetical protein n=1 Tax=Microbulbifer sp. ZKSA002 TaxID=3243388 RepID=UPI00403A150D
MIDSKDSLLRAVKVQNILSYLNQNGWVRDPDLALEKLYLFKGPISDSGKPLELRIPKRSNFIDFYDRIADAVNLISLVAGIPAKQVIADIKSCFLDTLGLRVLNTGNYEDSLSIEDAYKDVIGLRNLIIYSACSEKQPSKHFDTPTAIGHKHSNSCRFGHTFRGSFGFTIESPLMSEQPTNHQLIEPPFERRVIERIARGLSITKTASNKGNPDILVESYEKAFNSKMCEALLQFSKSEVEFSFGWSKEVSLSNDITRGKKYLLNEEDFKVLNYAASKLKEVDPVETIVMGKIINLHCTTSPEEEKNNRSIIIKHNHEDRLIEVKAVLNRTNYVNACRAHSSGQVVSITGDLERKGAQWEVLNITKFEIN